MPFRMLSFRSPHAVSPLMSAVFVGVCSFALAGIAQTLPSTQGETLAGKQIMLSDAIKGHPAILIGGFSHEAGDACGAWFRDLRADPAFKSIAVYEVAEIEKAPSFVRGMIKSGMRKGMTTSDQQNFVVLTRDDANWRSFFQVQDDKDPYVVLLGPSGEVRWRGHGKAKDLETQLKAQLP